MSEVPHTALKRASRRGSFWFLVVGALTAAVFGWLAAGELGDAARLAAGGVATQATVIDRDIRTRHNSSGGTSRTYRLTVRFQTPDGQVHEARHQVTREVYQGARPGQRTTLWYLPDDPSVSELRQGRTGYVGWVMAGLAGLTGLGAGVAGIVLGRVMASQNRALRRGEGREARVIRHVAQGKGPRAHVAVEWTDSTGAAGRSDPMPPDRAPQVGATIRVHIDPATARGWYAGDLGLGEPAAPRA